MSSRLRWALLSTVLVASSIAIVATTQPASAAVSNTPVWIGAPYDGSYMSGTRPGTHGGNQIAFDYYGPAGRTVKIYAAPKNSAYNSQITAHITQSGAGSNDAAKCGYYAVVEIRHSGNPIGRVTFSHLTSKAATKSISRWGGTVGTIAKLPYNSGAKCYQVSGPSGAHTHIEFRNYNSTRPACAHDYGAVSKKAGNYQGYLGVYSKAPLSGNRCPSGI